MFDINELDFSSSTAAAPKPTPAPRPSQHSPAQATPPPAGPEAGAPSGEGSYAQPNTVMEALIQRRAIYKSMADKAKEEQNDSKARRIGRIVKVRLYLCVFVHRTCAFMCFVYVCPYLSASVFMFMYYVRVSVWVPTFECVCLSNFSVFRYSRSVDVFLSQ